MKTTKVLQILSAMVLTVGMARSAQAADAPALPVDIAANDANVHYVGRFDTRDAAGPRCAWSGSGVVVKFQGTALNVKMKETGGDRYQVVVDGKPTTILETKNDQQLYSVASGLPQGAHTIALMKRTEAFVGTTQFLGFQASDGGKLLALPQPKHRIEVIGDSISCGYGNEGKDQNEHFSADTENAFLTYGAIASRAFDADFVDVAWSGKKMWPDNAIPELYDRALPSDADSKWDFTKWTPDVVIINLATNDFGKDNPEEKGWTEAYEAFIARLRKVYPKAEIYCAAGSMMNDNWPPNHKALSTLRAYLNKIVDDEKTAGDTKVHVLEFEPQDGGKNGLGSDWHPNVKTHQLMADKLIKTLQKDMNWELAPSAAKEK